jgi:hypothetical protein
VDLLHVAIDHLEREVFLVPEVMVERPFRRLGRFEQRLDAEIVVALLGAEAPILLREGAAWSDGSSLGW